MEKLANFEYKVPTLEFECSYEITSNLIQVKCGLKYEQEYNWRKQINLTFLHNDDLQERLKRMESRTRYALISDSEQKYYEYKKNLGEYISEDEKYFMEVPIMSGFTYISDVNLDFDDGSHYPVNDTPELRKKLIEEAKRNIQYFVGTQPLIKKNIEKGFMDFVEIIKKID